MLKYLEFFRIAFLNIFAFRARYYIGVVSYLVYIAIYYYLWQAVYADATVLNGFTLAQMTTYVAVGWIARGFSYNNLDREIEQQVISGRLALDLLKPVDFQLACYARATGECVFRFALFAMPTALIAMLLFPIAPPVNVTAALLFFISAVMAAFLFIGLNFLVGALAIPLKNIEGLSYAKQNLVLFLSGLVVPFEFLPAWLGDILRVLPFAGISHTPLQLYLGQIHGSAAATALALQVFWTLAMFVLGRMLWMTMMRRIVIQGG
jgi:ABC-2 type transport system permease protein